MITDSRTSCGGSLGLQMGSKRGMSMQLYFCQGSQKGTMWSYVTLMASCSLNATKNSIKQTQYRAKNKVAQMIITLHDIKLASTKLTHLKQFMTLHHSHGTSGTAGGGLKSVIPCHPPTTWGETVQRSNREHISVGFELWGFFFLYRCNQLKGRGKHKNDKPEIEP